MITRVGRRTFLKMAGVAAPVVAAYSCADKDEAARLGNTAPVDRASVTWDKAPCRFCGTGCGVMVGVEQGRVVAVRGDEASPVNKGLLCVKGYHLPGLLYGADRLLYPQRRQPDGSFSRISWDDALDLIADRAPAAEEPQTQPEPRPRLVAVPDAVEDDLADESAPDDIDTAQPEFSDDLAPDYSEETVAIPHPSSTEGAPAAAKPAAKKAAPRKPKARRGRASVPSWDEILFGATRPDDQP